MTTPSNCSTTVTNLAGNTAQGDTVTVTFTTTMANEQLTLVSYIAPGPSFSDSTAYEQAVYQSDTQTFATPGNYSLTVKIPNTYYQIDFVCGPAISQLEPNQNGDAYGPDSANITYHAEDRFIASDGGGSTAPSASSLNSTAPAAPTPVTTAGGTAPLTDSATLTGGYSPIGTITFYLFAPGATSTTPLSSAVYTDTVTVTGNNTYTTAMGTKPGGYTPTATGTYEWVAVYSGDCNNSGVTSGFGSEPEKVTSAITISGTKYQDLTGNGFSADDAPQGGVTIDLYTGSVGGTLLASTKTLSDGAYSFTNLMPGTYYVQEAVPSGYIQTGGGPNGSAGNTYYTVTAAYGQTYAGNNFDDFQEPTCTPTGVSFTVNNNNCLTTVSDLRGNTQQGDTVTVKFTVPAGPMSDQLSLVSYIAPGSSFNASTAYQQQIFDVASGTFAPGGTYTLTVLIPNCYYQIDFICGPAINVLGPQNVGPDSGNIFYTAEDRLLSADNGGTQAFSTKSVASGDFGTTALWTTSNGQNLLDKLNGGSSATNLAQWLATTFPNLYGSGAGSHSLVNSNGSYFTNSQVVSAYLQVHGRRPAGAVGCPVRLRHEHQLRGVQCGRLRQKPRGPQHLAARLRHGHLQRRRQRRRVRRGEQHHADRDAAPGGPQRQHQRRGVREFGGQRGLQRHQHVRQREKRRPEQQRAGLHPGPDS